MKRLYEDLKSILMWMVCILQITVGFKVSDLPHLVWLFVGAGLVIGGFVQMGLWLRWCVRISVRERTFTTCDACAEREGVSRG